MSEYPITSRNKVKRVPRRAHYDQQVVHAILDSGFLCHVSFVIDGQPYIIPTIYGRSNNILYLHGAATSRMLTHLEKGFPVCLAVTHLDGLVLARSAFHHSANYRSAVIFGSAVKVADEKKNEALRVISDHILKGRWEEVRAPNDTELKATSILAVEIEQASAKIREGGPVDDPEDHGLDIWAGHIPLSTRWEQPITDPELRNGISLPGSLSEKLS